MGGAVLALLVWTLCTIVFLRGETDEAYLRVSSPAQRSMILGTSRAAQGLKPAQFEPLAASFAGPMYNFAFTSGTSPWGPTYSRAIEMKLAPAAEKPGLFIVEVSPLSITARLGEGFREEKSFLGRLHSMTSDPNLEYALYNSQRGADILEGLLLMARGVARKRLHADGWLEISLSDREKRFLARLRTKLLENTASFDSSQISPLRLEHLSMTLERLKDRGRVAMVRLPVDPQMLALEQQRMPDFDARMKTIAAAQGVGYFDLTDLSPEVLTNDGSHLARESSATVTRTLVQRLQLAGLH